MPVPVLSARIKETDDFSSDRIDCREIWPLVQIARHTRERQVRRGVTAAMLPRDDVLDLKGKIVESFRHPAVFAPVLSPRANGFDDIRFHGRQDSSEPKSN